MTNLQDCKALTILLERNKREIERAQVLLDAHKQRRAILKETLNQEIKQSYL